MIDAACSHDGAGKLREAMKSAKGRGNFCNLFMYAPNGKKGGIQLLSVSYVAAKDEFWNIKNITRDDLLAVHRVPSQLMEIIPSNTGGVLWHGPPWCSHATRVRRRRVDCLRSTIG